MSEQIFYSEGAGNSFFLSFSPSAQFEDLFQKAKDENLNPDGYILSVIKDDGVDFKFYNNDGSRVDFCGNAMRALGLCYQKVSGKSEVLAQTDVGPLYLKILSENKVRAQMPGPQSLDLVSSEFRGVLSGVPHLVFNLDKIGIAYRDKEALRSFCSRVRARDLAGAETYNLTFYKVESEEVLCVTFERGVEDFTLACGSGALSVFFVLGCSKKTLKMPGGRLEVRLSEGKYFMTGPARIIQIF